MRPASYEDMEHVPPHPVTLSGVSAMTDLRLAVRELYETQRPRMLRFAAARLGDADAARDAVNETFLQALRRLSFLRDPGALEGWVWSILVNVTRQQHRFRITRPTVTLDDIAEVAAPDLPEVDTRLRGVIRRLPERQRTVIFLRYFGDLAAVQIGELLDIAPSTVRATLHQGQTALRKLLTEEGYLDD